jgi:hypothetical protein
MLFSVTRATVAAAAAALLALTLTPVAAPQRQDAQADKRQQERLQRARSQELQPLVQIVNAAMTQGEAGPADFPVDWHNEFLKASDEKTYVPFTLTIRKGDVTARSVAMYLRVVPKGANEIPERDPKAQASVFPFEDVHFVELRPDATGDFRFSRAFAVPAGAFDVYIAMRERDKKEGAKTALVKREVEVPDLWSGELTTSSMILTDRMEPLQAPLSRDQQIERPYALGSVEIVPALDSKIPKSEVLSLFFLVYNTQVDADKKPNITIDYNFHQKVGTGEKYFNKTSPQDFNAETLPPQFDFEAGHQLVAGQSVPLASFPEGDYRLEVRITDKLANKTVTRNVEFTVEPAS